MSLFVLIENFKSIHMSKQFFFVENAASHATRSFHLCIDRCENEKRAAPPTFLCWPQLFILPL